MRRSLAAFSTTTVRTNLAEHMEVELYRTHEYKGNDPKATTVNM